MGTQDRRLKLHEHLCEILGSRHVYFQPPSNIKMQYPCIVYQRNSNRKLVADNRRYTSTDSYDLTYIDSDGDSDIPDKIEESFAMIRRQTRYIADNLYHDPYYLYY